MLAEINFYILESSRSLKEYRTKRHERMRFCLLILMPEVNKGIKYEQLKYSYDAEM